MTAFCFKCRQVVKIKNAREVKMKNGRPGIEGVCSCCGTRVFKVGKNTGGITY